MKVLIIEDESGAARRLQKMILNILPEAEIAGICDSVASSVQSLNENVAPHLIFMDIQLADGLSFDIFSRVQVNAPVIFTTAYDEYALRAFKVNSIDYLLKPIDRDELQQAIHKFKSTSDTEHHDSGIQGITELMLSRKEVYRTRFLVSKGHKWIPISVNEVAWFISEEKHVSLVMKTGQKHLLDSTLEQLEDQLDPKQFIRANRKFIVCDSAVVSIENGFNGKLHVNLTPAPEEQMTVSREKASEFRSWLAR